MTAQPSKYVVRYPEPTLYAKALAKAGGVPDHIDGLDYYRERDFERLEDARKFRDRDWPEFAYICERYGFNFEYPYWDWEEKEVE